MEVRDFLEKMVQICDEHELCCGCPLHGMCSAPRLRHQDREELVKAVESYETTKYWVSPKQFVSLQAAVHRYEETGRVQKNIHYAPMFAGGFGLSKDNNRCIPLEISRGVLCELLSLINSTYDTGLDCLQPATVRLYSADFVVSTFHKAVDKAIEYLSKL